jgi:hypothetical protein
MASDRLRIWETLFQRAPVLIDSAGVAGAVLRGWTFGGGTVLMRRHRHRFSKDVDIFVPDPQYLGYLTPRLNPEAEKLTADYAEEAGSLKLRFPEGEIDFVVAGPLTPNPTMVEILFDRAVDVETSAEIVAKKVWHRGDRITARDIFDLAMVADLERDSLHSIRPILRGRREIALARIAANEAALREAFGALEVLEYRRTFDECVELVKHALR